MFDLVNGLPVHVLVIHAVVVLVPLSALGAVAIALKSSWRRTYGPLLTGIALVATVLCPVATSSGEALQERVGDPGQHAELGELLIWFMIPLTLLIAAMTWYARRDSGRLSGGLGTAVAALTVVLAVATIGMVVWIGDTGAQAAWSGRIQAG
ncbi:hypothetical protein KLP28_08895 [Nocardioidaceae bacterium]|nr:hypothetical protein KLP28_08895 [Nocardioidaceae bacterium]